MGVHRAARNSVSTQTCYLCRSSGPLLDMKCLIIYYLIAVFWAAAGSAAQQCTVTATDVSENIDGELLVLDAGSLAYRGPHPSGPAITDAAGCAAACSRLPECNAWTFCSNPEGCGSGCSAWVKEYPKLRTAGISNPDPKDVDLPVKGFGAWTFPQTQNGCQYSFATDSTSDAWPFGLCSLKKVGNPASPTFHQRPAAVTTESSGRASPSAAVDEGWVSGTFAVSVDCQGLPASVCQLCGGSKDPEKCLKCARDSRAQYSKKPIKYLLNQGNKAQDACAVCASLSDTEVQDRCFDCILSDKACSTCVHGSQMWGYGKPNVPACLTCTRKKGDNYSGACNACAQSKKPGRCFACLDSLSLKFCAANQTVGTDGCQLRAFDQTPCDLCSNTAKSDAVYKQCTSCYMNANWQNECNDCGNIATTADDQARCYKCIQTARFTSYEYSGCASCFSDWVKSGQRSSCLKCVEDKSVRQAAKSSCASCVDSTRESLTTKNANACLSCLKTKQQDYSAMCVGPE